MDFEMGLDLRNGVRQTERQNRNAKIAHKPSKSHMSMDLLVDTDFLKLT